MSAKTCYLEADEPVALHTEMRVLFEVVRLAALSFSWGLRQGPTFGKTFSRIYRLEMIFESGHNFATAIDVLVTRAAAMLVAVATVLVTVLSPVICNFVSVTPMSTRFWPRERDPDLLFSASTCLVQTSLKVDRHPTTGEMLGYSEVILGIELLFFWPPVG